MSQAVENRTRTPLLIATISLLLPLGATAQVGSLAETSFSPWIARLSAAPYATMGSKLEKTLFKVDVLTLTLRVDGTTADRIGETVSNADKYDDDLEDPIAEAAIQAPEAVAEIEFLRGVRLDQFLGGIEDDMRRAVDVGWLRPDTFAMLRDSLPVWFGFLEERKIHDGDRLQYHIRGNTLRTVYWGVTENEVLLDQTDVGRQNVLALLGAYFAPRSSFRRELVQSLWRGWDPQDP